MAQRSAQRSAAAGSIICIQGLSVYGQSSVLAQSLEYSLEPSSHDPGGTHTISLRLVALLSSREEHAVRALEQPGGCFIKLNWNFPGSSYPEFTTRHLLDTSGNSGDLSFSGGLGWAHRAHSLLETARTFKPETLPSRPCPKPSTWPFPTLAPQPPCPNSWLKCDPAPRFPRRSVIRSREPADDEVSEFSDLTSEPTVSDATSLALSDDVRVTPDAAFLSSAEPTSGAPILDSVSLSFSTSSLEEACPDHDWAEDDKLARQQLQIELLHRQRRDAVARFAKNGDTSGLLAVMAAYQNRTDTGAPLLGSLVL